MAKKKPKANPAEAKPAKANLSNENGHYEAMGRAIRAYRAYLAYLATADRVRDIVKDAI